ncbi:HAD domain-containing protein [Paraburkholderia sp. BR10937]|uniref:HAD domain-containing protein n=1 Tax=Paraburkholderia sp. BR10937 TaxID=3236994 RepID=UPI0034D32C58
MQVTDFRPADVTATTPPEIEATSHPVLFLDFDGVLHACDELALDDNFRLIENPNLFMWCPVLERILAPFPEVRVVVSSDWRRRFDDAALIELLGPLGARFAGVVEGYGPTRAAEILAEVQRRSIALWLALDDHPSVVDARHGLRKSWRKCSAGRSPSGSPWTIIRALPMRRGRIPASSSAPDVPAWPQPACSRHFGRRWKGSRRVASPCTRKDGPADDIYRLCMSGAGSCRCRRWRLVQTGWGRRRKKPFSPSGGWSYGCRCAR